MSARSENEELMSALATGRPSASQHLGMIVR